jgi:hypothetical protein
LTTTDTGTSLAAAAVIAYVIQLMKNSNWKIFGWISRETPTVTRLVAVVLSGIATIGIHATFNGGTLVVTGLSATVVLAGLWKWGVQFAYTHGWFKATSQSDELLKLLRQLLDAKLNQSPAPLPIAGPVNVAGS